MQTFMYMVSTGKEAIGALEFSHSGGEAGGEKKEKKKHQSQTQWQL